ncbi:MAG: fibronectin type III domain-containing protein, partial [Eubacterium sp.]|nr:fibronectin type III domain-containing protein [Eubacterium sp.]
YRLLAHYNSLSNKMDNSLLAVRVINHKYIVVENGSVHAIIDIENKDWAYDRYEIRYSESANMKNSTITTLSLNKGNVSKKITGLKKGKTYYFQFRAYVDAESGAGSWVGKRKVKIVR